MDPTVTHAYPHDQTIMNQEINVNKDLSGTNATISAKNAAVNIYIEALRPVIQYVEMLNVDAHRLILL